MRKEQIMLKEMERHVLSSHKSLNEIKKLEINIKKYTKQLKEQLGTTTAPTTSI